MKALRQLAAAVVVLAASSLAPLRTQTAAAGPQVLTDAQCESCHAEAARSWRTSLHHVSASNAPYEKAVFTEALPFCRACHAPHGDPTHETDPAAREAGITCTTCHLRAGSSSVLAAPREGAAAAPHAVERTAALSEAVCVRCHEFDFPNRPGERMQKTGTEHHASPYASTSCAACHMPPSSGQRSHAFSVSRDPAVLSRSVAVTANRDGDRVRFVLEPRNVGHALPTGDLFRRLVLTVDLEDDAGRRVTTKRRYFARIFGPVRHGDEIARSEIADERIFGRTEVTFDLQPRSGAPTVRWRLDYERVALVPTRHLEQAVLDGSVTVAAGAL